MNVFTAVQPLLALVPPALLAGESGSLRSAPDFSRLVPDVQGTVAGIAADAMTAQLHTAVLGATSVVGVGPVLDDLAGQASRHVDEAIRDMTSIAGDCLQAIVEHVCGAGALCGPLAGIHLAGVLPIAEEHRLRAEDRLNQLGKELGSLTRQVETVDMPGPPIAPSSAELAPPPGATAEAPPAGYTPTPVGGSVPADAVPAGDAGSSAETPGAPSPQAAAAVAAARSAVGTPYQWGGTTPGVGMDCSGLTQWAYAQAGVDLPRTADAQAMGTPVTAGQLAPGDLVVWDGHVAMYVGDGQMVEAGDPVQINPVRTENIGMNFLGFYRPTA